MGKDERLDESNESLVKKLEEKDEEIQSYKEEIQRYKKELANNSIIERWQIGQYLHDNLAQDLSSAKITLSLLRNELSREDLISTCDKVIDMVGECINGVRNLSHDILPMDVKKEGVGQAFDHLKEQAENQYGINCIVEKKVILDKIKRREVATNLYHIAQEAIKNAVVHGEAENIKIYFIENDTNLHLHIKDDGKGFHPADENNGMGITIMRYRAEELGGALKIKEAEDDNYTTCVICYLPLESLTREEVINKGG